MTFSSDIRETRRALRLTQSELAARLDVDKQTVSNWECGRCVPWAKEQARVKTLLEPQAPRSTIIDRICRE